MTRAHFFAALTAAMVSASSFTAAHAGDFRVVPGTRIGSVRLGMTESEVIHLLHKPTHSRRIDQMVPTQNLPGSGDSRTLGKGVVLDTWLGPLLPKATASSGMLRNYVTVFFVHERAAQIEVSSSQFATADGLTTSSSHWEKRLPPTAHFTYNWLDPNPDAASPAAKHVLLYSDNVGQGIACKYGVWGMMGFDPPSVDTVNDASPEAVIVHRPGQSVLLNPNDAEDYSGTGHRRDLPKAER